MADVRKIFRTAAYKVKKEGKDHVMFWSIDPSYWQPSLSYVREHDLYEKGSTSLLVTGDIPPIEALRKIEELERDAKAKYAPADETYKRHQWLGDNYRDAGPWTEHPALQAHRTEETLKRLRAQKPSGFKPK
jgi:hypothetical protein